MKYYLKAFRNYAAFKGRASRKEFWWFFIINISIYFLLCFVDGLVQGIIEKEWDVCNNIYMLIAVIPMVAISCRRLHDINMSGVLQLIPFINIILYLKRGDIYANKYGEPVIHEDNL